MSHSQPLIPRTHVCDELNPLNRTLGCSPTWQEYPWNLKVHYLTHKKPLLVHILCQINLVLTVPSLYQPFQYYSPIYVEVLKAVSFPCQILFGPYLLPFLPGVMSILTFSFFVTLIISGDACGRQNVIYINNCRNSQNVVRFFSVCVSEPYLCLSPLIFFYFSTPFLYFVPVYLLLLLTPQHKMFFVYIMESCVRYFSCPSFPSQEIRKRTV